MLDPNAFGYSDLRFSWGDHICAIFDYPYQQEAVMGGYVAQGLRAAQRCVWVAAGSSGLQFRRLLSDLGGDLPTLEGSGQLLVFSEVDFYLRDGLFDAERVLDLVRTLADDGQQSGFEAMRVAADTSWLRGRPLDPYLWEELESRLTQGLRGLPVVMVCQYDRRQVSGSVVIAAFRTHPIVILGETVYENQFYQAPGPTSREVV